VELAHEEFLIDLAQTDLGYLFEVMVAGQFVHCALQFVFRLPVHAQGKVLASGPTRQFVFLSVDSLCLLLFAV